MLGAARTAVPVRSTAGRHAGCRPARSGKWWTSERCRHNSDVSQTIEAPVRRREPDEDEPEEVDRPWVVIVWNDPVNLMTYVTIRLPEAVRLQPGEGRAAHAPGAQRGQGRRSRPARARRPSTTSRGCTRTASGRRCSRTRHLVFRAPMAPLGDGRLRPRARRRRARHAPATSPTSCVGWSRTTTRSVGRLFPAAFRDDPEAAAEYDRLVRDDLVSGRLAALDTLVRTVDAERLDAGRSSRRGAARSTTCDSSSARRLGVTEDVYDRGIDPRDPHAPDARRVRLAHAGSRARSSRRSRPSLLAANQREHLVALALHQLRRARLEVEPQQRLGVRGPHVEVPVLGVDRDPVEVRDVALARRSAPSAPGASAARRRPACSARR